MRFFSLVCLTCTVLLAGTAPLAGQSLRIYSEFQRIDPFGRIVPVDRSEYPREILSPELARNAHSTFHVAVTLPANTSYFLYAGSNPGNIIETHLYKEEYSRIGDQWFPDTLTPLHPPYFGVIPDATAGIPGQTTRCYLLDIWVPPNAPVQRVRVEVLMKIGVWYVAPMEMRIISAQVPPHSTAFPTDDSYLTGPHLSGIDERVDLPAMGCLAGYLLGRRQTWAGGMTNIRDVIRRDAEQDMAIVRGRREVPQDLWFLADEGILQWWMRSPAFNWSGAEWYLRVRDWIYRYP